ncbi:response regulator transcription factor [Arthrobacter sp. UC242_113]|uniref:response regulator transcription factor n=1 Tax=Arthrobacter sp. UC242_113 TaxID=3374550 RepID=UPI003757DB1F
MVWANLEPVLGRFKDSPDVELTMTSLGVAVVVEDDADMRNLLRAVLEQTGFAVYTAASGAEGVDLVRHRHPRVVTVDVGLPDVDGFEVLRRIRSFSSARVVMLTGRADEADINEALHHGADEYVTKPFRPKELRTRIEALLASGTAGPLHHAV